MNSIASKEIGNINEFLTNKRRQSEIIQFAKKNQIIVVKNFISSSLIKQYINYFSSLAKTSLPNYQAIKKNAPNFHRLNDNDKRAYVHGAFHQFVFFPWNQDVFGLFDKFNDIFKIKNILSENPPSSYMDDNNDCTIRIAFQFYPSGKGFLKKHIDPFDFHQKYVGTLIMSKKGVDFTDGGLYIDSDNGKLSYVEELFSPGDVIFFSTQLAHGVKKVDPHKKFNNWLDNDGRWMGLFATNKFQSSTKISDSLEL